MFYLSPKIPPSAVMKMARDHNCYWQRDSKGNLVMIPMDMEPSNIQKPSQKTLFMRSNHDRT